MILILVTVLILGACGPRSQEARRLLEDVAAGPQGWSTLRSIVPAPDRRAITYAVEGRQREGDLYLPAAAPRARVVLVPGLSRLGRNDPRLVAFANALARVRFAVLVPDIEGLRQLRASPEDAAAIGDAAAYLARRSIPDSPTGSVGIAAVSYAVGPTLMVAMTPGVAEHIAFVLSIGGYYDMAAVITFITTGYHRPRPGEAWQLGRPSPISKWLFAEANAVRLVDPADRIALLAMARRRLADLSAPIDDLAQGLGPDGRAVFALLTNTIPDRVPSLIDALPPLLREEFATMSPSAQDWRQLRAQLYLVHGRNDPMIPASESQRLSQATEPGGSAIYIADGLTHVEFDGSASILDIFILLRAAEAILFERDRLAGEL